MNKLIEYIRILKKPNTFAGWKECEVNAYLTALTSIEKKVEEINQQDTEILDDAMGLLANHNQHEDSMWIKEYNDLYEKYMKTIWANNQENLELLLNFPFKERQDRRNKMMIRIAREMYTKYVEKGKNE